MCQSEQQLENDLITQLKTLGFAGVKIKDAKDLEKNLKYQLEKFNRTEFSNTEFERILNHLNKGNSFQKSHTLRDRFVVKRDDDSAKEDISIKFFDSQAWCKNEYQVTHQVTQKGKYENRYDVTLLINGLPLVQIELKRRGIEMKEAFNQINRYQKHSFAGTLFDYLQIFVISNGVNTKYFANNAKQSFAQTFYWTDKQNNKITKLQDFADIFLEKCQVSQMIAEYIVLSQADKIPMILRPYQYFAVKEIENRVKNSVKNGYIWHTTGSGKTLTSFKTAQLLAKNADIEKILFVVDRKDLDIQTVKEFNSFSDGAVDGTDNTKNLVQQLKDPTRKLIVTTIQKLDRAIAANHYSKQFEFLEDKKIVIIFDECHRSQFGKTHKAITEHFQKAQLFGFTGTPIFAENNNKGVTTKDVFDDCLHKYIITNAISDENVLGFSVEYVQTYKEKEAKIVEDIEVPDIDTQEVLESSERLEKITKYVLQDWKQKTKSGKFNAMFAVSSQEMAKKYYSLFQKYKPENFKIATIFTYQANEESKDTDDNFDEADSVIDPTGKINEHSRDFLDNCISEYNSDFGTNFSTDTFDGYYKDVQSRVKDKNKKFKAEDKRIDLVIVVNMMLTGFDAKTMNTLYVDKNLRYHGLIQAYSRTNRLFGKEKPHGNIVSFRNLKENTDKALELYGDGNAQEIVFKKNYEAQKKDVDVLLEKVKNICALPENVTDLQSEEGKAEFIKSFRNFLRAMSSLQMCGEFSFENINISSQEFEDYKSKYWDLYDERVKHSAENNKISILDEIDFELELMIQDTINFDYIISLLLSLGKIPEGDKKTSKVANILKQLDSDVRWRKKKELIQKFIEEGIPNLDKNADIEKEFSLFWDNEKRKELKNIATKEKLDRKQFEKIISEYIYTQKFPRQKDLISITTEAVGLLQLKPVYIKIKQIIIDFVDKFEI